MEKILSIVWYKVLPPVFGGQKVIAGFNKYLARHHQLVCLCSGNNESGDDHLYKFLPVLPVGKMQFINPLVWRKIKSVAQKEMITHIILEHPYHGFAAIRAQRTTGSRLIVHSHNIESERFKQLGKWWWWLLSKYERWTHRKADLSLFITETDREFAIKHFGLSAEKCLVIPYGIERTLPNENAGTLIRERYKIDKTEKIFLFAGTLDYFPNTEAVRNIVDKVVPCLEKTSLRYKIIVCGRNRFDAFRHLARLSHPGIIMAGEVTDIENYFDAADVFINPVLSGGGIQTKNIDALAHHCPVVCFENMADGIPGEICGSKLLTVTKGNWEQFAELIMQAALHKEQTPDAFFAYFNWENIIRPLSEKIKSL